MKHSIIFFFLLLLPFISNGQGTQNTGAPTQVNAIRGGARADSAQWLPTSFAQYPWFDSTGRIWYNPIDSSLYYHTGHNRIKVGSGGGGGSTDTSSLSNRIDLKLNKADSNILGGYLSRYLWLADSALIMSNFSLYMAYTDTASMLAPYERSAHAAATYYPLSNPNNYTDNTPLIDTAAAHLALINSKVSLAKHTTDSTQYYLSLGDTASAIRAFIMGLPNYGISPTDIAHWNTAYNKYIVSHSFNPATGVLTITLNDATTVTANLDGRYLKSADWVSDSTAIQDSLLNKVSKAKHSTDSMGFYTALSDSMGQVNNSNNISLWVGVDSVDMDGDSVPQGYGTTTTDSTAASDITRMTNVYVNNISVGKSFSRDIVCRRFKYCPYINVKRPSVIWMGMNDLYLMSSTNTDGSGAINGLKGAYATLIANTFLNQFFPVTNITKTGTWVNLGTTDSLGSKSEITGQGTPWNSQVAGSALSLQLKGTNVVVGTFSVPDTAIFGRFSVTVDGINKGIYNPVGQCADTFFYNNATSPGVNRLPSPSVFIVSGLSSGIHNVTITTLDNKRTYFDYVGTMKEPAGCTALTAVHINRNQNYRTTEVDSFNTAIDSVVGSFRALGYKIAVVKTENYVDTSTDIAYQIHLNDQGHRHMAYGILEVTKTGLQTIGNSNAGYGLVYNATNRNTNLDTTKAIIQGGTVIGDTTRIINKDNKAVMAGFNGGNNIVVTPGLTYLNSNAAFPLQSSNLNNNTNLTSNTKGTTIANIMAFSAWYENALRFLGSLQWNLATDNTNPANSISKLYITTQMNHSFYRGFILTPKWNESSNPLIITAYGFDDSVNYTPYGLVNILAPNNVGNCVFNIENNSRTAHVFQIDDLGNIRPLLNNNSSGAFKLAVLDTNSGKLEAVRPNALVANNVDSLHISNDSVYYCKKGTCTFSYMRTSGGGSSSYSTLTDVNLTSISDGQLTKWSAATGKWVNFTPPYISSNQIITLSGDVTGIGATSITTTLKNTGTAGTYGDATHVPQFTTDAQGRVTSVTSVAITGGGGGTPGGSSPQLQYNNAGSFGGLSNTGGGSDGFLQHTGQTTGAVAASSTAGTAKEFNRILAGHNILATIDTVTGEILYQAHTGMKNISHFWGWALMGDGIWNSYNTGSAGTSTATYNATNLAPNISVRTLPTSSTAGTSNGVYVCSGGQGFFTSSTRYGGGMFMIATFTMNTYNANQRFFCGFSNTAGCSLLTNADQSGVNNTVGINKDVVDATFQFLTKGTGTATKTNTTITPNSNDMYRAIIFIPSNSTTVYEALIHYTVSGWDMQSFSATTNIPAAGVQMYPTIWVNNGSTAAVRTIGVDNIYTETDF